MQIMLVIQPDTFTKAYLAIGKRLSDAHGDKNLSNED